LHKKGATRLIFLCTMERVCRECVYFVPSIGRPGHGRCDCTERLKRKKKNWFISEPAKENDLACPFFRALGEERCKPVPP